jgi:diguanylate cyclase (GGDEF)-like protein
LNFLPLTRDCFLETTEQHAIIMDLFANRLAMILDLESALREIADLTRITLGADKARVVPANQFNQVEEFEIPRSIFQKSIDLKALCVSLKLPEAPDKTRTGSDTIPIGSILCVPVLIENKVVSLIYAQKNYPNVLPFDQTDLQLAIVLSHQTGLTIQRAKLLEESQKFREQAITDSLTGINNRRQILHLLEIEFHRAQRFRHPLTIIIFDLDGLKQINDKYGHLVGDQALQLIAQLCRCQLREIDSIGRFGGDEFIILLVETNLRDAYSVLTRIRESMAERSIDTPLGPLTITISIGVASMDDSCPSSTSLLNQADNSLLEAKKTVKTRLKINIKH